MNRNSEREMVTESESPDARKLLAGCQTTEQRPLDSEKTGFSWPSSRLLGLVVLSGDALPATWLQASLS